MRSEKEEQARLRQRVAVGMLINSPIFGSSVSLSVVVHSWAYSTCWAAGRGGAAGGGRVRV